MKGPWDVRYRVDGEVVLYEKKTAWKKIFLEQARHTANRLGRRTAESTSRRSCLRAESRGPNNSGEKVAPEESLQRCDSAQLRQIMTARLLVEGAQKRQHCKAFGRLKCLAQSLCEHESATRSSLGTGLMPLTSLSDPKRRQ